MASAPLASLPARSDVILDASVLIHGLRKTSGQCRQLLRRCAGEDVYGYAPVEVLSEVCHVLMLAEAVSKGLITAQEARQLKGKFANVKGLQQYWNYTEQVYRINVAIVELDDRRFAQGHPIRKAHGLLTTDSLVVTAAQKLGVSSVATNDRDFEAVTGITVYRPSDV